MPRLTRSVFFAAVLLGAAIAFARPSRADFTMAQVLGYPYPVTLVASKQGNRIAWVLDGDGSTCLEAVSVAVLELVECSLGDGGQLRFCTGRVGR